MSIKQFKNDFTRWAIEDYHLPKSKVDKLKDVIDNKFWEELHTRNTEKYIVLRPLSNSEYLSIEYSSSDEILYQNTNEELIVGTITPSWKRGWSFIKDEDVQDIVKFFLHFAEQFIARSRALNVTGAIALTYRRACDFRFKGIYASHLEYFNINDIKLPEYKKVNIDPNFELKEEFKNWISILNCLDPLIHRAIYNYWKGIKLFEQDDFEESVTAFVACISVISEYCQNRLDQVSGNRLSKIESLNISPDLITYLEDLETLRNHFGAHPSHTKWWDFAEIFADDLEVIIDVLDKILLKLCENESNNRIITRNPDEWDTWLQKNCVHVFNAVWFHKLPPLVGDY